MACRHPTKDLHGIAPATMEDPVIMTIEDLKEAASTKLSQTVRDYYNGGSMQMITLRDNEAAFDRFKIRPRILVNVADIDTSTTILGSKPCTAWHDGERATSRAAANKGIPMVLSTYSTVSLEDARQEGAGNPYAFQLSIVKDQSTTLSWIKRAEAAGYKALFITVDAPVLGRRLNERSVYTPADVQLAISHKLDGIVVSNHGGRQLDGVPATIDALVECAAVAKGQIKIGIDGGIRRGADIFRALALGADFCFLGRVPLWGLAYRGQEGVERSVEILEDELKLAMALAGCASIKDITRDHVSVIGANGLLCKL
ncbi:FMN-dependent dehydrogenase [Pestalotiopsis sp. NC0098]|nr:FMN-dependent dehydrogenase [Pestalotiopsis sp. NC0098]